MNSEKSAAQELVRNGYATVDLGLRARRLLMDVFTEGERFFTQDLAYKQRCATPTVLEGFREMGAEYSETPDRPDLTETFSHWPRNSARPDIAAWAGSLDLYRILTALGEVYKDVVGGLLAEVRDLLNPLGQKVQFQNMSYLQLNFYEPARHSRDLLQDPHEDGHLVTVAAATEKGLEAKIMGEYKPIGHDPAKAFIMPGSLLTAMSGGRIPPLFHQVRRHPDVARRQSLMFFVNPSLDDPITPWVVTENNKMTDIRDLAATNSARFGLPSISEVHGCSE